METSNTTRQDTTLILALIAALIVAAFDRSWLARPVTELIPPDSGIRLDWLSHLKGRIMQALLLVVEGALRRGRPVPDHAPEITHALDDELARVKEQYELRLGTGNKAKAHEWLVEVCARLEHEHGITKKRLCETMGISERTFRSWRARPLKPPASPTPPEPPPERQPRGQGRFDLDHTMPGIQQIADTTDWEILGIPLKLVASQDPGGRHTDLWSGFRVSVAESGQMVIDLVDEVAEPGTQAITDRGTPYMSQTGSLDEREIEHALCKEYTPTEKATKERAFRTVKDALEPIRKFFARLADSIPALRCPALAVELATVLLTVFLRVYNLGHRNRRHPLEGSDPDVLRCIAEEQRENARSDFVSKLSTLGRIHDQYDMQIPRTRFVRGHRAHALKDIVEAERRMRPSALRGEIKVPHLYFAAVLNDVAEQGRKRRSQERARRNQDALQKQDERRQQARLAQLDSDPVLRLHHGLDLLSCYWRDGRLFLDGVGPGRAHIRSAIIEMATRDPLGYQYDVHLECNRWRSCHRVGNDQWAAMSEIVDELIGGASVRSTPVTNCANLSCRGREV